MFTLQIQFYYIIISNNQQTRSRLFQTPKNIPPAALNPSSLFKPDTLLAATNPKFTTPPSRKKLLGQSRSLINKKKLYQGDDSRISNCYYYHWLM